MSTSPSDVQAKLTTAMNNLARTKNTYPHMVSKYGSDWKKWPTTTDWYKALSNIDAASAEVNSLVAPAPPTAQFSFKEV